ncbi:hypothetical protein BVX98_04945 [bacterium F11]|nr:hypothetical protein BVX98_04945 [bacterium F11]
MERAFQYWAHRLKEPNFRLDAQKKELANVLWLFEEAYQEAISKRSTKILTTPIKGIGTRNKSRLDILWEIILHIGEGNFPSWDVGKVPHRDPITGCLWVPGQSTYLSSRDYPREGYPVDIQALWYNALIKVVEMTERVGSGDNERIQRTREWARKLKSNFHHLFWNERLGYLYDGFWTGRLELPSHARPDASLRPNQIFPVIFGLIEGRKARILMNRVNSDLVVPGAVRGLSTESKFPFPFYDSSDDVNGAALVWLYPLTLLASVRAGITPASKARLDLVENIRNVSPDATGKLPPYIKKDPPETEPSAISVASTIYVYHKLMEIEALRTADKSQMLPEKSDLGFYENLFDEILKFDGEILRNLNELEDLVRVRPKMFLFVEQMKMEWGVHVYDLSRDIGKLRIQPKRRPTEVLMGNTIRLLQHWISELESQLDKMKKLEEMMVAGSVRVESDVYQTWSELKKSILKAQSIGALAQTALMEMREDSKVSSSVTGWFWDWIGITLFHELGHLLLTVLVVLPLAFFLSPFVVSLSVIAWMVRMAPRYFYGSTEHFVTGLYPKVEGLRNEVIDFDLGYIPRGFRFWGKEPGVKIPSIDFHQWTHSGPLRIWGRFLNFLIIFGGAILMPALLILYAIYIHPTLPFAPHLLDISALFIWAYICLMVHHAHMNLLGLSFLLRPDSDILRLADIFGLIPFLHRFFDPRIDYPQGTWVRSRINTKRSVRRDNPLGINNRDWDALHKGKTYYEKLSDATHRRLITHVFREVKRRKRKRGVKHLRQLEERDFRMHFPKLGRTLKRFPEYYRTHEDKPKNKRGIDFMLEHLKMVKPLPKVERLRTIAQLRDHIEKGGFPRHAGGLLIPWGRIHWTLHRKLLEALAAQENKKTIKQFNRLSEEKKKKAIKDLSYRHFKKPLESLGMPILPMCRYYLQRKNEGKIAKTARWIMLETTRVLPRNLPSFRELQSSSDLKLLLDNDVLTPFENKHYQTDQNQVPWGLIDDFNPSFIKQILLEHTASVVLKATTHRRVLNRVSQVRREHIASLGRNENRNHELPGLGRNLAHFFQYLTRRTPEGYSTIGYHLELFGFSEEDRLTEQAYTLSSAIALKNNGTLTQDHWKKLPLSAQREAANHVREEWSRRTNGHYTIDELPKNAFFKVGIPGLLNNLSGFLERYRKTYDSFPRKLGFVTTSQTLNSCLATISQGFDVADIRGVRRLSRSLVKYLENLPHDFSSEKMGEIRTELDKALYLADQRFRETQIKDIEKWKKALEAYWAILDTANWMPEALHKAHGALTRDELGQLEGLNRIDSLDYLVNMVNFRSGDVDAGSSDVVLGLIVKIESFDGERAQNSWQELFHLGESDPERFFDTLTILVRSRDSETRAIVHQFCASPSWELMRDNLEGTAKVRIQQFQEALQIEVAGLKAGDRLTEQAYTLASAIALKKKRSLRYDLWKKLPLSAQREALNTLRDEWSKRNKKYYLLDDLPQTAFLKVGIPRLVDTLAGLLNRYQNKNRELPRKLGFVTDHETLNRCLVSIARGFETAGDQEVRQISEPIIQYLKTLPRDLSAKKMAEIRSELDLALYMADRFYRMTNHASVKVWMEALEAYWATLDTANWMPEALEEARATLKTAERARLKKFPKNGELGYLVHMINFRANDTDAGNIDVILGLIGRILTYNGREDNAWQDLFELGESDPDRFFDTLTTLVRSGDPKIRNMVHYFCTSPSWRLMRNSFNGKTHPRVSQFQAAFDVEEINREFHRITEQAYTLKKAIDLKIKGRLDYELWEKMPLSAQRAAAHRVSQVWSQKKNRPIPIDNLPHAAFRTIGIPGLVKNLSGCIKRKDLFQWKEQQNHRNRFA